MLDRVVAHLVRMVRWHTKREWRSLHVEYVALVERTIETVLATARASVDDLYALLEAHREHARGQRFLDKFLSMGDYHVFCGMMRTWSRLETVKAQSRFIDDEQAEFEMQFPDFDEEQSMTP